MISTLVTRWTWRWENFGSDRTTTFGRAPGIYDSIELESLSSSRVCAEPPRTNPDIMPRVRERFNRKTTPREFERARRGAGIKSRGRVFAHVLHRRPDLFADSKLCRTMHPGREPLPLADYKTGKGGISMDALLLVPGASSRSRDHRRFNRPLIRDALLFAKKEKKLSNVKIICISYAFFYTYKTALIMLNTIYRRWK